MQHARTLLAFAVLTGLAGCSKFSSLPSSVPTPPSNTHSLPNQTPGLPSPSGGGAPSVPSPPSGTPPGAPSPPGGATPSPPSPPGSPSSGSGQPSSYENPAGGPPMPGGGAAGDGDEGDGASGPAGTEMPSWIPGGTDAAGGPDGEEWETSNELPGTADIPPMPSETGLPGDGSNEDPGLDGELNEALEDFDGGILAEREIIRERSNETAGTQGSAIPVPSAEQGPGGAEPGVDNPGGPMGVPRARNAPPAPVAGTGEIPDDIPDAKDDDIIARQLREAAMQETDPELKEKLWDEYRRYKGA